MRIIVALSVFALAGCSTPSFQGLFGAAPDPVVAAPVQTLDLTPPPAPPVTAITEEQFDTTSQEERSAAIVTEQPAEDLLLGITIASLGAPTEPGIWLKTPLVTALALGRIEYEGKTINVELRPSGGIAGSGSQISLAAMRLIEAPLTGLPELKVFAIAP